MSTNPQPNLTLVPLCTKTSEHTLYIIAELLSGPECASIIQTHKNFTESNVTPGTIRTREQFDDAQLSATVWERMRAFLERMDEQRVKDEDGQWWRAKSLNSRWRLCFYEQGGKFSPHQDGRRLADLNEQSFMTVNIYLNTVPDEWKAATRFLSGPPSPYSSSPVTEDQVLARAQPVQGTAAIFRDDVWHDGDELLQGKKYLLRTDILYERESAFNFEELYGFLADNERAKKMLRIAEALEDAGNFMEAVVWYKKTYRLCPRLENGDKP